MLFIYMQKFSLYNSLFFVFYNSLFMSLTTSKFHKQLLIINRQFP